MALINISTIFNIDLEFETSPVYKRILAYLVDLTIISVYLVVMKSVLYGAGSFSSTFTLQNAGLDMLIISLPMLLYPLVCEVAMHGQTPGKKMMNIRVVSLSGGEPALSQYLLRWMFRVFEWPFLFGYIAFSEVIFFSYLFITLFLGVFVAIIITATKRHQRLGDLAANTVVVNTKSDFSVYDTVFMNIDESQYTVRFPAVMRLSDRDINTIKNILDMRTKKSRDELALRVSEKIQTVLDISTDLPPTTFLETLLADYNYLATRQMAMETN